MNNEHKVPLSFWISMRGSRTKGYHQAAVEDGLIKKGTPFKEPSTKFPQYYEVNDSYIKLDFDPVKDKVYATTKTGTEYDLYKLADQGGQITESEYKKNI